jgi:peptidoglycan/LPS O-acetylase OafA/YrhL
VDWLKTLAIVAVVVTHSGRFSFEPLTPTDRFVRETLVAFHVPVFLMVSGYLHATAAPVSLATVGRRWRQILGPYLLTSLVMLSFGVERPWPLYLWPYLLALGGALGLYYDVPVWLFCVLTGWVWSRLPPPGLAIALVAVAAATVGRWFVHVPMDFVWYIRDPLLQSWLLSYLFGWCAARYRWVDWIATHRSSAFGAAAWCVPWLLSPDSSLSFLRSAYGAGIAWLVVVLVARPAPAPVQWIGRETLLIYLWHVPVASRLTTQMAAWPDLLRTPVQALATLGITIGGILVVRRLQTFGRRLETPGAATGT